MDHGGTSQKKRIGFKGLWTIALLSTALAFPAQGQAPQPPRPPIGVPPSSLDVQRIAAVVNEQVVTGRDVDQRLEMTMRLLGMADSAEARQRLRPQILQTLIDERIQVQETTRRNITITEEDLGRRLAQAERQFNVPAGRLNDFLASRGVDRNAFILQMRNEAGWQKMIFTRLLPTVTVTDEEVSSAMARILNSAGDGEVLMSEIFLAVESGEQEEEVRRSAQRLLEQVRTTGNFAGLARLFSQGMTAAAGGDMGWVQPANLPEEISAAAVSMQAGTISEPIRAAGGYYIIAIRDKRRLNASDPGETRLNIKQILVPLPANASPRDVQSQTELAGIISETVASCEDADRVIAQLRSDSGNLGTVRLRDLPENIRTLLTPLKANQSSAPVRTANGVSVFTVCQRVEAEGGLNREQVRDTLITSRLSVLVRRYMRDLTRDALVERR